MKKLLLGSLLLVSVGLRPVAAAEGGTLPPGIYQQMKRGTKLGKIWIAPGYDTATGFQVGRVTTMADDYNANSIDYLPYALSKLAIPGSTNILNVTVTSLTTADGFMTGAAKAIIYVEGQIVDKDGKPLFAFTTREANYDRETPLACARAAMDRVVWSLGKDLGEPFQKALAVKTGVERGADPSGLPTLPKNTGQQSLSVGERLIQLDNLRKSGLITEEEYQAKRAEIVKGM